MSRAPSPRGAPPDSATDSSTADSALAGSALAGSALRRSPLTILPYTVADGAANMATDEAMLDLAREGRSLLRFYGWAPWCLSLGRNQPAPPRLLGKDPGRLRVGVDAVRRPTGGRSVFHGPEITYAFACPDRAWGGPREVYRRFHGGLAAGLAALGVPLDGLDEPSRVERTGPQPAQGVVGRRRAGIGTLAPSTAACFRDPAPGELTVAGRKLVGSAQWRRRGALLQHGSILLENRQRLGDLDAEPSGGDAPGAVSAGPGVGLREVLASPPHPLTVVAALSAALERAFAPEVWEPARRTRTEAPDVAERVRRSARRYEPGYRSPAWLWRRPG